MQSLAPLKVRVFVQTVFHNSLDTGNLLQARRPNHVIVPRSVCDVLLIFLVFLRIQIKRWSVLFLQHHWIQG